MLTFFTKYFNSNLDHLRAFFEKTRIEFLLTFLFSSIFMRTIALFFTIGDSRLFLLILLFFVIGLFSHYTIPLVLNSIIFQSLFFWAFALESFLKTNFFLLTSFLTGIILLLYAFSSSELYILNLLHTCFLFKAYDRLKNLFFDPSYNESLLELDSPEEFSWSAFICVLSFLSEKRYGTTVRNSISSEYLNYSFRNILSPNLVNKRLVSGPAIEAVKKVATETGLSAVVAATASAGIIAIYQKSSDDSNRAHESSENVKTREFQRVENVKTREFQRVENDNQRAHEIELIRLQNEENERQRAHQKLMEDSRVNQSKFDEQTKELDRSSRQQLEKQKVDSVATSEGPKIDSVAASQENPLPANIGQLSVSDLERIVKNSPRTSSVSEAGSKDSIASVLEEPFFCLRWLSDTISYFFF